LSCFMVAELSYDKEVNAYCAAERYDLRKVEKLLQAQGYNLDPFHTGLHGQVVHVQMANYKPRIHEAQLDADAQISDMFVFPSGTLVTWNLPSQEAVRLMNWVLPKAAEGSHLHAIEEEEMRFLENPDKEDSEIIGDTIVLGTKAPADDHHSPSDKKDGEDLELQTDMTLAKIAFSSGLARSPKLAVLESQLNNTFQDTRAILSRLSQGTRLPFTKKFIIKKIAELLQIRAQLNLYTDLTDTVPDMLWDSRYELGLERYYDEIGRALDVDVRIDALNDKIQYTQDIATVLREQLSENHGIRLEWIIIALIAIEVVFELSKMYREYREHHDPDSTENMLRRFLGSNVHSSPKR
jgi:required for meiotic nuclear division protein 1